MKATNIKNNNQSMIGRIKEILIKMDHFIDEYVNLFIDQIETERRERKGERG